MPGADFYPGLRGVHNNEESANNIVSEDCVDDVVQEDIKNVVPLINEKSVALQKNYIMLHYVMQYYIKKNYIIGSRRKPGDVRQDVRHPRNPRVITISETGGSSAELRLRRRAQGGCAVEGYTRAISNRATTTMRHASATTTMRLRHADRRSRGMCCQGRIEKRRTESRIERLQREDGSVVRPLRGPL